MYVYMYICIYMYIYMHTLCMRAFDLPPLRPPNLNVDVRRAAAAGEAANVEYQRVPMHQGPFSAAPRTRARTEPSPAGGPLPAEH